MDLQNKDRQMSGKQVFSSTENLQLEPFYVYLYQIWWL
ncbi:hypothetical protein BRCON_2847 [Candidatus Sumerlaea chitinivorans]|uniref:Uncharacterized protein n=1 Tax=Sumerlaea chitinivorans TaxID=2250252 RepID=A0A2Z4Y9K0_SUMC1|nr:hypothetical protein BRCON_2847 [Candidatus Sumerlaea chitinivorans]